MIPVDLYNPGQVFACLGFLEAAEALLGDAEGGFDWSDPAETRFHLRAAGTENPINTVLNFLAAAKVYSIAPAGSQQRTEKWKIPTVIMNEDDAFPFPDPPSPATLPAVLEGPGGDRIVLDHWGDATVRDTVKFWAGSGGYPGAALAKDALDLVHDNLQGSAENPFSVSATQASSFRFDWRRDYIPLDAGFSPNAHNDVSMLGYPLVEILAAIGLGNARPQRINKLSYRYGVVMSSELDPCLSPLYLRAVLGCARLPFPTRVFRVQLGWPGQENQARCITDVVEENSQ